MEMLPFIITELNKNPLFSLWKRTSAINRCICKEGRIPHFYVPLLMECDQTVLMASKAIYFY